MQGEAAQEWNPDPRRVPEPPVKTHRIHSDAPDPGAAGGLLPPFTPGTTDAGPHTDLIEVLEPTAATPLEPTADVELEPIADIALESAQAEPAADPEIEEAWLLDEIVDVDEEPHDALGEALQEAVARAAPPFAEDLVRSGEQDDQAVIQEPPVSAAPPGASPEQVEVGTGDAEMTGALDRPGAANPSNDGFTEGLASTLESLAGSLRARGFNALDDAFARGDRLEASLALFLAGYRAGRGE